MIVYLLGVLGFKVETNKITLQVPHQMFCKLKSGELNINKAQQVCWNQPVLSGGERRLVNDRLVTVGRANTYYFEHTVHDGWVLPYFG